MNLIDRVLTEPEFRAAPPVLVDVGAAGGVHQAWRRIAPHAIGVGFEPDARDAAPLEGARKEFARWILCRALAVPDAPADGTDALHLTDSPQCSSALAPNQEALGEWAFAGFFRVVETRRFPALTVTAALAAEGIERIDWLKCDTQGLDLKLFRSLPPEIRARLSAVEFEPGLIDAYAGEDRLADVLAAMAGEPFWLSELEVGRTARGRPELLRARLGATAATRVRQFGPSAPAWVNVRFLRDVAQAPESLDRRAFLLAWVIATITGQHGQALTTATLGAGRFAGGIFAELESASARSLRWSMVGRAPAAVWRRLMRG